MRPPIPIYIALSSSFLSEIRNRYGPFLFQSFPLRNGRPSLHGMILPSRKGSLLLDFLPLDRK
jgi:hypothetical protein